MNTSLKYSLLGAFVLIFLCFSSCKKNEAFEGTFELSGTVRDELTGNPIAFADVSIIEREKGWTAGYAGKLAGSQIANEKGEFVISFNAKENGFSYEIVATEDNKYFEDNTPPWLAFTKTGKGRQDITLMPKGYLKLHIKGNKGGWNMGGGGGDLGVHYSGTDTIKIIAYTPNIVRKITYGVYDINMNLIKKETFESLIPPPPDTAFYLIEF